MGRRKKMTTNIPDTKEGIQYINFKDINSFIKTYKGFVEDPLYTVKLSYRSAECMIIAYYEKDDKEFGYALCIDWKKIFKFLKKENKKGNQWVNIHHYAGTFDPVECVNEEKKREFMILTNKLSDVVKKYPEFKDDLINALKRM
jgi:hypothetical protein